MAREERKPSHLREIKEQKSKVGKYVPTVPHNHCRVPSDLLHYPNDFTLLQHNTLGFTQCPTSAMHARWRASLSLIAESCCCYALVLLSLVAECCCCVLSLPSLVVLLSLIAGFGCY